MTPAATPPSFTWLWTACTLGAVYAPRQYGCTKCQTYHLTDWRLCAVILNTMALLATGRKEVRALQSLQVRSKSDPSSCRIEQL